MSGKATHAARTNDRAQELEAEALSLRERA